jgi:hypothetical protein
MYLAGEWAGAGVHDTFSTWQGILLKISSQGRRDFSQKEPEIE